MRTITGARGASFSGHRFVLQAVALLLVLVFAFAHRTAAQLAGPQPPNNLNFADNFFVTGDYAVGGVSLIGKGSGGFSTGTISIGADANPGVKGTNSVPQGAEVVAALLYWQTIEAIHTVPGGAGSGQSGFFRPLINGGPQTGYSIQGTPLTNNGTVFWDSSGCNITSSKQLVTYRAEVRAFLPLDANGNVLANGSYEVRLPSQTSSSGSGSNTSGTPNTIGATLVIIYRVLSPNFPLNSIVIYDGTYAPPTSSLTTMQTVQGFYQAAANPAYKLTYIVSGGVSSLKETVSLKSVPLPSLYGNMPPYPGWYPGGHWDNPTWVFPNANYSNSVNNALKAGDSSILTMVNDVKQGCVDTAAIIFSTTVQNSDGDGLLDVWKANQGYCDASFNEGSCNVGDSTWVALPQAARGRKDVFMQLDYMCYGLDPSSPNGCDMSTTITNPLTQAAPSVAPDGTTITTYMGTFSPPNTFQVNQFLTISGFTNPMNNGNFIVVDCVGNPVCTGNLVVNNANGVNETHAGSATFSAYSFDPRQVTDSITGANSFDEVSAAYANKDITLHPEWHAMQETPGCQDSTVVINNAIVPSYCPYLNQPGLVGWKGGFDVLKGEPLNGTEADCEANPAGCVRRFQHGRKDSYHEVMFAHAQGGPEWSFLAGTLTQVVASGDMVTFTTSTAHGLAVALSTTDQNPLARVTVSDALSNTMLSGTYLVKSVGNPTANSFTIQVIPPPATPLCPVTGCTRLTDPTLSVASGKIHTRSGFSDVGGADSMVTLGRWDPLLAQQVTGTTFMHEFGHANGLTHGGFYFDGLKVDQNGVSNNNYKPTVEANCKPNFQSVMNYPFQLNHLDTGAKKVVNYSEQQLDAFNEASPPKSLTPNPFYPSTLWYTPTQPFSTASPATFSCEGIKVPPPTMYLVSGSVNPITPSWANGQDINFDFSQTTQMRGHSDWTNVVSPNGLIISPGMNLLQVGATGADAFGSGGSRGPGGGSLGPGGGSRGPGGGSLGPGGGSRGPGGGSLGPGGGSRGPGGGSRGPGGGVGEVDFATATAVTYPPSDLTATEGVSPRTITLNWTPGFGLIAFYKIYRSDGGGAFHVVGTVNAPTTTFVDNPACNPTGYQYFVTAVQSSSSPNPGQESGPSNTVSTGQNGGLLTGCYAPTGFLLSAPANAVHGTIVSVTFTVQDDFNATNSSVNTTDNPALVTLVANGPLPGSCGTVGPTTLVNNGSVTSVVKDGVPAPSGTFPASAGGNYTFNWDTDGFCAGQYTLKLILDSTQNQTTPVQLSIDVTNTDSSNPHITTTSIPNGVVGTVYSTTILEDGGVNDGTNPFKWTIVSGSVTLNGSPAPDGSIGISFPQQNAVNVLNGTLSGTPTASGTYTFMAKVTDSAGNTGTQTLKITVTTPVAQINQALVPDRSAPGGAAFVLTLNGTGFGPGSQVLWNGTSPVTTFISNKQLTAAIPASDLTALGTASVSVSNPVTVGNKMVPKSNIDFFQISPSTSASLSGAHYNTGTRPNGLIAADFNGDGKIDLATANTTDGTVSILLGNGDGTFTGQPPLGAGSAPNSLTAGDFNGDGILDLAVANFSTNSVSIFLGNGNGTFQPAVNYAVANGPFFVIAGDFNRDGILDLAVANGNGEFVSILLGNGDGTFQPKVNYAAGGTTGGGVAAVALGDFDRDGELDLAVTNPGNGNVSVLLGKGDGTFKAPVAYPTGNAGDPLAVSAVDLRGTGILDLAVTNVNAKTVAVLLGLGDGTFGPKAVYNTTSSASAGPGAIITGDFNADGKVDLAITNQNANTVSILLGNGDGTLQSPLESTTGTFAAGVAAGDFNGDGRLDVAVADLQDNKVSVMLQRPEPATNLAVSNATASQVSLTWTASVSTTVVGYNVYRGTTTGGPYTKVNNSAIVMATAFTDMSVDPGKTYFYVVTAVDPHNLESMYSNEVSATTPPQPPTNLTVAVQGTAPNESVALNWNASTTGSVVSYNVYRATAPGGPFNLIGSVNNPANLSFTDGNVSSGMTYYYVVTAVANGVESANSNEASAVVP